MRSSSFVLAVSFVLAIGLATNCLAVGVTVAGKEECKCSPLVAKGIVPDTLNNLKLAFTFPAVGKIVNGIVGHFKAMLGQFGVKTRKQLPEPTEVKTPKPKKKIARKIKKKKRVKIPRRAM